MRLWGRLEGVREVKACLEIVDGETGVSPDL